MEKSSLLKNEALLSTKPPERKECMFVDAYDRHIDTIYRVCFSMMGNKQDAEDAAQSVFIKLIQSNMSFNSTEHEKAWLITTARNHCKDEHRKWWRRNIVDIDMGIIDKEHTKADEIQEMADYLRKLPPTYRLVLYLHYYEGYKVAEIAQMLKMNLNTVKTKMRNARKHLKLEIGDDYLE